MASNRRWDTDERGHGIGDARANLPALQELTELAMAPDWVAEDPEAHLLGHLTAGFEAAAMPVADVLVEPSGRLVIRVKASPRPPGELRRAVWAVLGEMAELSSHVRETKQDDVVVFEMVTGIPPGGAFATHGHTVRIEVEPG